MPNDNCYLEVKFPKQYPLTAVDYTFQISSSSGKEGNILWGKGGDSLITSGKTKEVFNKHQAYDISDSLSNRIVLLGC